MQGIDVVARKIPTQLRFVDRSQFGTQSRHQQPTRGTPQARRVFNDKSGGFESKSGGLASDSGSLRAETLINVSHSSMAAKVAFCGENRLIARNLSAPRSQIGTTGNTIPRFSQQSHARLGSS